MKTVYELLLPALAEFGISEMFLRANDRNQQPNSKDDGAGDELTADDDIGVEEGVSHDQGAKEDHDVGGAHGGLSGFGFSGQQLGGHTPLLANQGGDHAITETPRENVGPLLNRLVGDANGVCCGSGGTAEDFDGF